MFQILLDKYLKYVNTIHILYCFLFVHTFSIIGYGLYKICVFPNILLVQLKTIDMWCWILQYLTYFLFLYSLLIRIFLWSSQAGSRTIDIELTTLSSTNHIELNPSDAGFQDRYIVQEIIKEMAKNRPIDTKGKKGYKSKFGAFFLSVE